MARGPAESPASQNSFPAGSVLTWRPLTPKVRFVFFHEHAELRARAHDMSIAEFLAGAAAVGVCAEDNLENRRMPDSLLKNRKVPQSCCVSACVRACVCWLLLDVFIRQFDCEVENKQLLKVFIRISFSLTVTEYFLPPE